jgi:hypothetical protein
MIAQTWSEIFIVSSPSIGWLIWANPLAVSSAASPKSLVSNFMVSNISPPALQSLE